MSKISESLPRMPRPANPKPARPLSSYIGTYRNVYYGPIQVREEGNILTIHMEAAPLVFALTHWNGDVFTFNLFDDDKKSWIVSKASFSNSKVILEYYDDNGFGTFMRASPVK
jgi:hypothetical protein